VDDSSNHFEEKKQGMVLCIILKEDFSLFKMNSSKAWILIYQKARLNLNCYAILQQSYILSLAFINKIFVISQ